VIPARKVRSAGGTGPPIQMCDGADRNVPKDLQVIRELSVALRTHQPGLTPGPALRTRRHRSLPNQQSDIRPVAAKGRTFGRGKPQPVILIVLYLEKSSDAFAGSLTWLAARIAI
jgi:hypothetical protein